MKDKSQGDIVYAPCRLPFSFPLTLSEDSSAAGSRSFCTHFHDCIELSCCLAGGGTLMLDAGVYPFCAGDHILIPDHTPHRLNATEPGGVRLCTLYFDPCLLFSELLHACAAPAPFAGLDRHYGVISSASDGALSFLAAQSLREAHGQRPFYQDALRGTLLALLTLASSDELLQKTPRPEPEWLFHTLRFIRHSYCKKLSVPEIAEGCCHMSASYFRKSFLKIMSVSPLAYINELRIRNVCRLLYNGDKSVNEIALAVGFPTLSSFHRNFHTMLGCTPSEWQRKHTEGRN